MGSRGTRTRGRQSNLATRVACRHAYESVVVPLNTLLLVGVGVGETVDGASLATEQTVKVWTNLVSLALLQVVALRAAGLAVLEDVDRTWIGKEAMAELSWRDGGELAYLEKVGTLLGVTCEQVSQSCRRQV